MSEFMFLYRSTQEAHREVMGSPERAQQSIKKWRAWFKEMSDKGQLKSSGQPLERVGKVVAGKGKGVTDGPYAETKDVIGGYSIVVAKDVEVGQRSSPPAARSSTTAGRSRYGR